MHHAFSFLISIHLMLLFIRMAAVGGERSIVFQYISCYCLSVSGFDSFISAHLFQYISCYCLSGLSLGLFNDQADFNTSHVTVYLTPRTPTIMVPTFQYISCYCLSLRSIARISVIFISIHLMLLFISFKKTQYYKGLAFQYISCYCLSCTVCSAGVLLLISIHLMLLFITTRAFTIGFTKHFNTSHVTVYLSIHHHA